VLAETFALVREAASRSIGMRHFDVQLMAGWAMARGMLAEMETGEGKTLAATLPACAAALAGTPVHVISANDYLVTRDAEALRPLYSFLGLEVAALRETDRDPRIRQAAYACDVVYVTARGVAFDHLRDRLASGRQGGHLARSVERLAAGDDSREPLLRGLCLAIVDEADSVLIDDACTPLILSATARRGEGRRVYRQALRLAGALEEGRDFLLQRSTREVKLTDPGRDRLKELSVSQAGIFEGSRLREEWVLRALRSLHLLLRDRDYLVCDGEVQIVDQATGRLAHGRFWEMGLHQLVEVKEGCEPTPERETVARISYQHFFRRYLRLAGATGTAREVARELWSVYGLEALAIPTRRPLKRRICPIRVFAVGEAKWRAVIESVRRNHEAGRPVLVGTWSVGESERLSRWLRQEGLAHQVLNARQDAREAEIVALAGGRGRITVATDMAGRGTDIRLGPEVAALGGLHVIGTRRAEAARIDRQLAGRCGRQGDPGSFELLLSLEDERAGSRPGGWLRHWLARRSPGAPLPALLGWALTRMAQRAEERRRARARRALVDSEEALGELLAFAGRGE
jgi:preprotein translocase subunit SecA